MGNVTVHPRTRRYNTHKQANKQWHAQLAMALKTITLYLNI